jgi:hypothetical protein
LGSFEIFTGWIHNSTSFDARARAPRMVLVLQLLYEHLHLIMETWMQITTLSRLLLFFGSSVAYFWVVNIPWPSNPKMFFSFLVLHFNFEGFHDLSQPTVQSSTMWRMMMMLRRMMMMLRKYQWLRYLHPKERRELAREARLLIGKRIFLFVLPDLMRAKMLS